MQRAADEGNQTERLFNALVQQLKTPLLQIAYDAELAGAAVPEQISLTAERAIHLLDSYLLAAELRQQQLELEPVSIASVLYDTAEALTPYARTYNCGLDLRIGGKYEPVMADHRGLRAALLSLGQSFIEAQAGDHAEVILAGYKTPRGIAAGLFGGIALTPSMYRRALGLYGRARHALPELQAASGAGLYIADTLFKAMSTSLTPRRHDKLSGLAATFQPSRQLQLV